MATPTTGGVSVSGTAAQLSSTPLTDIPAFVIKAPATNTATVFIGPAGVTTSNGFALDPGDSFEYQRDNQNGAPRYQLNLSDFYAVGTAPDVVTWLASR